MVAAEVSQIQKRLNRLLEKYKSTQDHSERRNLILAVRLAVAKIDLVDNSRDGGSKSR
jgi:hypothetical protein